jgi:hypothetical protein
MIINKQRREPRRKKRAEDIMALSVAQTGKYTSERHEAAKQSGKFTAGEVARLINNRFKLEQKITAAELRPFATEWHHSGFYKQAGSRSTMGKTWFFDLSKITIEKLVELVLQKREEGARIAAEPEIDIYYFAANFKPEYGSYRKKYWQPIASFGIAQVKESQLHNFLKGKKTQITFEDYELLIKFEGRYLESYETFNHFKERMLNGNKS